MGNKEQLTAEEVFEKRLTEVIQENLNSIPEVHITPEQLYELAKKDKRRRRKRFCKYASMVAAVFILICFTTIIVIQPQNAVPVDAEKNLEKQMKENESSVIIYKSGQVDNSQEPKTIIEKEWGKVKLQKDKLNDLYIPEYRLPNYKFDKLVLEVGMEKMFTAKYYFTGINGALLMIKQSNLSDTGEYITYVEDEGNDMETSWGKAILYKEGDSIVKTTISIKDSIFTITPINCNLTEEEYRSIIEGIEVN